MDELTPAQRYYQKHKEARQNYGREYYAKNRERILASLDKKRELVQPRDPPPVETTRTSLIQIHPGMVISFD